MWCPKCGGKTKVNGTVSGETVDRFRKCTRCGLTYQTVEAVTYNNIWRIYAQRAFETNPKVEQYKQQSFNYSY